MKRAKGRLSEKSRKNAKSAYEKGQNEPISRTRSKAREKALKREPISAASHIALSQQALASAKKRSATDRSKAAKKAAKTKGPKEL